MPLSLFLSHPSHSLACLGRSCSLPSPFLQLGFIPRHCHSPRGTRTRGAQATPPIRCCFSHMPPLEEEALVVPPTLTQDSSSLQKDSLSFARAYWVTRSVIAWNVDVEDTFCYLYASKSAQLFLADDGIKGQDVRIQLELDSGGLPENVIEKFPHISDYKAFRIPNSVDVRSFLKCQLAIASFDVDGKCNNTTGLQLPGVVDDLFPYSGPLGSVFMEKTVSLYLWAPTAQVVCAYIYRDPFGNDPLGRVQLKEVNGVWSVDGPRSWEGCYYVYEVSAYHPSTLQIETCMVNDPYARGLSSDGMRTLLVNLDSDALKPEGWDELADEKPDLSSFSDISIYELHIRDFSANDPTVHPEFQGGYLAFTAQDSLGVLHLRQLSEAGLTHVHLLPSFQFGGVADEKEQWKYIDEDRLSKLPPDSDEQQAELVAIQEEDGYNWGYNPVLWGVPKGSYASNPNGPCRTLEFRKMVQALNRIGLRVVLDVVYNHVHGSGPLDSNSVLDKVVPGYYLRRNTDGCIEHSTCTNNTASEHFMVERLIVDDLLCWAVDYKVGLAANLRDFVLTSHKGVAVKGSEVLTHDRSPVAYALCPTETVNYVSAHDNETLFDIVSLKTPLEITLDERCRINHLATTIVALSQGIPFFHAGDEILRSKSLDRDSYNSGDWFNRLDFSYESNNWGVGLPPKGKNESNWPLIKPRLADPSFKPQKSHILAALENFKDMLRIRYSSQLFHLRTANAIQERVRFHNTGPSWVPGVIVMSIEDGFEGMPGLVQLDPIYSYIVVIFNASPTEVSFVNPALKARNLQLHPIQLTSSDKLVKNSSYEASFGRFIVPPRTTSVFVEIRKI